jgi:hypothetical protein
VFLTLTGRPLPDDDAADDGSVAGRDAGVPAEEVSR